MHDFVGPPVCGCWVAWLKLNTPTLCSDYNNIKAAYEAMKNVACLINERKRKLESIDKIARWQVSIVGWEVRGSPPPLEPPAPTRPPWSISGWGVPGSLALPPPVVVKCDDICSLSEVPCALGLGAVMFEAH